jgi:hypothetical protein
MQYVQNLHIPNSDFMLDDVHIVLGRYYNTYYNTYMKKNLIIFINIIFIFFFFTSNIFADFNEEKPLTGKYEVVVPYSISGCVKYVGYGIRGGECLKNGTTLFNVGDIIYSHDAFYNSDSNAWDIGIEIYDQYRSIPLSNLEKVSDAIPITSKNVNTILQFLNNYGLIIEVGLALVVILILISNVNKINSSKEVIKIEPKTRSIIEKRVKIFLFIFVILFSFAHIAYYILSFKFQ